MNTIQYQNKTLAIIKRAHEWSEGLEFFTPSNAYLQVGGWCYPSGKELKSHQHKVYDRTIHQTQELVYIIHGALEVTIYNESKEKIQTLELRTGDLIVLLAGGHGYKILDPQTKVLEVKNGPFISPEHDKEII